ADCRNNALCPAVLTGNTVSDREELRMPEHPQPLGKPADIVLSRPVRSIWDEDHIGRAQGSPYELRQARCTVNDNLIVGSIHRAYCLLHALLHLHEDLVDLVIVGLLRYHHQRFFVVEVMRAGYDIDRGSTTVGELHVTYFAGNVVSVLDRIIIRDLRK